MSELKIFNKEEFGTVRVLVENGKVLFCGKDVAILLGYSNSTHALKYCKEGEKRPIPTISGDQMLNFVNKNDLSHLIARSRQLPIAKRFKRWIFEEVLPSVVTKEEVVVESLPYIQQNTKEESYQKQMSNLQVIESRKVLGFDFKIYGDVENPLFLAKDVASWIDYDTEQVGKLLSVVAENEKTIAHHNTITGSKRAWFLTEDGLYEVLMQTRKPIAKEFKTQVKQILKDIRKHGMYMTSQKVEELINNPDTLITTLQAYKKVKEKVVELEQEVELSNTKVIALEQKVESDKHKVLFAEKIATATNSILIRDLAKLLKQNGVDIGGTRLFEWMREKGYLIRQKGSDNNMPTQKAMDMGLFDIEERTIETQYKTIITTFTVKVTGKGQIYFINKLAPKKSPV
jgi:anti-repressor protein